ncbi:MBL fold metallo-hydrolase [Thermoactinomyces daqus]|uniref:MBL fold metallo-hydrolase n=1 Tax=Thermoactinomyces daqus TaxID=1329516 RepID=A0A7W2AHI9_9BACL|nr:MBL fold metallo-hydrolase [Thermoactinomyces daqus]MBA4543252.1 MBL fold metallo-hydrolase [Thermoactinomyces daqus]
MIMDSLFIIGLLFIFLVIVVLVSVFRHFSRMPKPLFKEPANFLKPKCWSDEDVTVGWVGHSTVLINLYGTKILTDPVLGRRVGVHLGIRDWTIGPKRHTGPALSIEELGHVDLILLSHAHMDHFDFPSLKKLAHSGTKVVTASGTGHLLKKMPFSEVLELGGEESIDFREWGLTITAVPVKHWGNRFPWNKSYGYTGYLLEKREQRIFYPGDTAYTPNLSKLKEKGEIDLALMPIGAYFPDSFQWAHCTPEQAWQMFKEIGAKWLAPIHWNTFVLSYEPVDEPIRRLKEAAGEEAERIVWQEQGEVFCLSKAVR